MSRYGVQELKFIEGEIPPAPPKKIDWRLSLLPLKAKENWGKWALVKDYPHKSNAFTMRRMIHDSLVNKGEDGERWELVMRAIPGEVESYGIYGRFLGEG